MNIIFQKISEELHSEHNLILVTIVSQSGSSPRGLGAQMLAGESGRICGSVGGGALEHRCEQEALRLLKEKKSGIHHFELRRGAKEDIGMICSGDVSAWFQFVDASIDEWRNVADALLTRLDEHREGWLVLNKNGSVSGLLDESGTLMVGSCSDAAPAISKKDFKESDSCYYIPLAGRDRAIVFGGGHCSQALVPFLSRTGFRVTVMESRPEFAQRELFPDAEEIICGDYLRISDYIDLAPSDYVVIMTNGHNHDLDIQLQVLRMPLAYVGVIGSKSKIAYSQKKLREAGIPEAAIASVHSPIGTPIKAVTPEEIAVSITGEMIYERALIREAHGTQAHGCPMH